VCKIILSILTLLFLMGCTAKKIQSVPLLFNYSDTDQSLIELLIEQGSDANKVHRVSFLVDCKTEKQVADIISKAKIVGFDDDYISYSEQSKYWSSSLSAAIKLNLNEISAFRAKLMPLIPSDSCGAVGWGASVEM